MTRVGRRGRRAGSPASKGTAADGAAKPADPERDPTCEELDAMFPTVDDETDADEIDVEVEATFLVEKPRPK